MDDALAKAKIENRTVEVVLPFSTPYTDNEGIMRAEVCWVDTYSVQFKVKGGRYIWLTKAFIVSVET